MPRKQQLGVPDLDPYLGKKRRTLCSYEEGANMYGLRYYSFVNLAKEADANIKVKRHALVNLDILDAYIDKLGEEEMNRREESRKMYTRNKTDKLEELKKQRKNRQIRGRRRTLFNGVTHFPATGKGCRCHLQNQEEPFM